MAIDVASDSRCKAFWRFESGALTADSKGSNTLTNNNGVAENTVTCKEGGCAADFSASNDTNHRNFSIDDASLVAGFPTKSGDTKKKMTVLAWLRPTVIPGYSDYDKIICKWDYATKRSWGLMLAEYRFCFDWGKTNTTNDYINSGPYKYGRQNVWQFIAARVDGKAPFLALDNWDDGQSSWIKTTHTPTGELNVNDVLLRIGAEGITPGNYYNGLIDCLLVFDDILSDLEVVNLKDLTHPTDPGIAIGAAGARVLYRDLDDGLQVGAAGARVIYADKDQNLAVTQIGAQIEYSKAVPNLHVSQVGLQYEWAAEVVPPVAFLRKFPVPPPGRLLQTQTGKRKFPVVV